MQLKTIRNYFTATRMVKTKTTDNARCYQGCAEKWAPSHMLLVGFSIPPAQLLWKHFCNSSLYIYIFKDFVYLFLERGREGEREGERHQCVVASYPLMRTWPITQAHALTGNRTGNPVVCRPVLHPLSNTSQGNSSNILNIEFPYGLAILFLSIYPREMKTFTNFYVNVHNNIICNSQEVETTLISINWWMDK